MNNQLADFRRAFLDETAAFYNLGNRSQDSDLICSYAPAHENTPGCAIGRHLPRELCEELDKLGGSAVTSDLVFGRLPEELSRLDKYFLRAVQQFHDCKDNWTDTGLSYYGIENVKAIKAEFSL